MTISMISSLWFFNGLITTHLPIILVMSFATSMFGYILAMFAVRFFVRRKGFETRFAGYFLFLIVMTVGCNSAFFSFNYWLFYHQWHARFLSETWMWQFIFTNAGALYQFAVLALPLYFPLGFIFLVIASYLKARPVRSHQP